jgi:hypothetical protein
MLTLLLLLLLLLVVVVLLPPSQCVSPEGADGPVSGQCAGRRYYSMLS